MRKSSTTTRRRSSSNPGRFSQQEVDRNLLRPDWRPQSSKTKDPASGSQDSMIPRPRIRSSSSDRLSGMRKSNLRHTTGAKTSIGQYTTASSAISPMPNNRYTYVMEKPTRPSTLNDQGNRGRASTVDQVSLASKGYITPKASGSRHLMPTSDGRIEPSSAKKVPKKDSRPLNDKNYQNEMLSKIDNYFHSIGQTAILNTNGSIKPFTLKIFIEATNLLLQLLDTKQLLTVANYIEEIPKIAKKLHYPGIMNRSWLKTANTMHAWPHAIGWISWLVELCEVKNLATEVLTLDQLPMIGETEEEKQEKRRRFFLMIRCYKAWNDEKPEDEERIVQQFIKEEAERRGIDFQKFEKVCEEYEEAKIKLGIEKAKTDKEIEEVNELKKTLQNVKQQRLKQQEQISKQQKKIEKIKKEIEQMNKDTVMLSKNVVEFEKTKEELDSAIKQQPMSVTQRDEIIKTCNEQQTYIQNFETFLEEIRKEAYSLDIRLVSSNTNLVKTILAYNQSLFMQLSDFNIGEDELLMPENGICESDFMSRLKEREAKMKTFMQERKEELNKKMSLLETLQTKRGQLSEKVKKIKASEEKRKQELKLKENKEREYIKKLQISITEINEQINKTSSELEIVNQQLSDAIDKKEASIQKNSRLRENSKIFFEEFNSILDDHRDRMGKFLETVDKK